MGGAGQRTLDHRRSLMPREEGMRGERKGHFKVLLEILWQCRQKGTNICLFLVKRVAEKDCKRLT